MNNGVDASSFRDPNGFLFRKDGQLFRQINKFYQEDYSLFIESGLYSSLLKANVIIPHEEVPAEPLYPDTAYRVIKPELIQFISYPYEWCFSQLRDAALATLAIQTKAMQYGMSLKDCSAYNIQFRKGKPVFIDTLSFEKYHEGQPWVAYRQFCQHFLAPLALMSKKDIRLSQLLRIYIDGIPLDLASSLLPFHTVFSFSLLSHVHLHARSQQRFADQAVNISRYKMSRLSFLGLIDSLESSIRKMKWQPGGTEWAEYYDDTNYSKEAFQHKMLLVAEYLDIIKPLNVWDLGANTGVFSRLASSRGINTISFDIDPAAVEKNYLECINKSEANILPLLIDLTNPSPGIGWQNRERKSLIDRGPADTVLALALIHHLAISNNVPLNRVAEFFSMLCNSLIIEFIPKSDTQVHRLLSTREDIFRDYDKTAFENEFSRYFKISHCVAIGDSERTLYLMEKHEN